MDALRSWWLARWRAFQGSYDPQETTALSSWRSAVATTAVIAGGIAILGYVPPLAELTGLEHPWIGIVLVVLGCCLSLLASRHGCRGTVGTLAILLDTPAYSAALAYTAATAHERVGLAVAALHAAMLMGAQAQHYALTGLFGVAVALPTVLLVSVIHPPLSTTVALLATIPAVWIVAQQTFERRRHARVQRQVEQALTATTRLADDSMHAALGTTLLTLGNFLHELRNAQTVVRANLGMLQQMATLDDDLRSALEDAIAGHRIESDLVTDTLRKVRQQAQPRSEPFELRPVIWTLADSHRGAVVLRVNEDLGEFQARGNPEFVETALRNLIRNAEQAGARQVWIDAVVEPSQDVASLRVHDDGPGFPVSVRERALADPLVSTKPQGTGLGLYLVRRYTELLGGQVSLHEGPHGGAEVRMLIPGQQLMVGSTRPPLTVH